MANLNAILSRVNNILTTTTVTYGTTGAVSQAGVGSSGFDGPSAWTQYLSSGKLNGHALVSMLLVPGSTYGNQTVVVDVGNGAAGSEVVKYRVNVVFSSTTQTVPVPVIPFVAMNANERVAFRTSATSTGGGGNQINLIAMNFVPRPY